MAGVVVSYLEVIVISPWAIKQAFRIAAQQAWLCRFNTKSSLFAMSRSDSIMLREQQPADLGEQGIWTTTLPSESPHSTPPALDQVQRQRQYESKARKACVLGANGILQLPLWGTHLWFQSPAHPSDRG